MFILRCKRCGREWCSRSENPYRCGKCKTPYWDRERVLPARAKEGVVVLKPKGEEPKR